MLYRIKKVFETPAILRLKTPCFVIMLIVINGYVLVNLFLPFLFAEIEMNHNYNVCILKPKTSILPSLYGVIIIMGISIMIDAIITFILLIMFVYRLCKMNSHQNNNINFEIKKQIKRHVIIGILCTSTSVILVIAIMTFGNPAWYFANIDQTINTLGVVMTFDWNCRRLRNSNNQNNPYQVDSEALDDHNIDFGDGNRNENGDENTNINIPRLSVFNTTSNTDHNIMDDETESDDDQSPLTQNRNHSFDI